MDHAVAEKSLTYAGVRPVNERAGFGLLKANRAGCRG
jgi:hypothetical protein